jgi:cob(I)alamin adenosyltransferase
MADGSRIEKDDALVQAIGDVDELNSQLAVLVSCLPAVFKDAIFKIQNELFNVGAELTMGQAVITEQNVRWLEDSLDELNQSLPVLKEFILPGGGLAASHCHVARAICRRAERSLVTLKRERPVNDELMAYMNRMSDYLFVLARSISKQAGEEEVYWQSGKPDGS